MPPDASKTREKLLDCAARAFAHDGVFKASLIDITRQAGQRNRAALRYHFGSRDGILCAVIDRHALFLARRERDLLDIALAASDDELAPGHRAPGGRVGRERLEGTVLPAHRRRIDR